MNKVSIITILLLLILEVSIFAADSNNQSATEWDNSLSVNQESCFNLRGDLDHNGIVDIADLVYFIDYFFNNGMESVCYEESDVNAVKPINISDLTYLIEYLYLNGPLPPIQDYPVYFRKSPYYYHDWIFRYHPINNKIDSIHLPRDVNAFVVSPDGKQFYLPGTEVEVFDIETQQVIGSLPYSGRVTCSPDTQLIAILGEDLYVIDADDYSLIYHDTGRFYGGVFSASSKRLYCSRFEDPNVYIFDLENNFSMAQIPVNLVYANFIPSHDETKLFILKPIHWDISVFEVYDFTVDSVIFRDIHSPGHGLLALSPDGKFLFYTNPGTLIFGTPSSPYFKAFDVDKNEIAAEISTVGVPGVEQIYPDGFGMGEIAVTADGRWVVTAGANGYEFIVAAEIKKMLITRYRRIIHWPDDLWWNLTSSASPYAKPL